MESGYAALLFYFMMCFTKSADTIINSEEKDCISLYASADTISSALQILLNDYDYNISNIGYIDLARFYCKFLTNPNFL